jgi:hypothetical protein
LKLHLRAWASDEGVWALCRGCLDIESLSLMGAHGMDLGVGAVFPLMVGSKCLKQLSVGVRYYASWWQVYGGKLMKLYPRLLERWGVQEADEGPWRVVRFRRRC